MVTILFGIPVMSNDPIENKPHGDYWCDFELDYDDETNEYYYSVETMLGFETDTGCREWMLTCFSELTKWMEHKGFDTEKEIDMYTAFSKGIDINTRFKTVEDAYAFMKFAIFGFHGRGIFVTQKAEY